MPNSIICPECGGSTRRNGSGDGAAIFCNNCEWSTWARNIEIDDREEEHPSEYDLKWDKAVRPLLEVLAEYMVCNCGGYETGNHLPSCPANIEPGAGRSTVTGEECC